MSTVISVKQNRKRAVLGSIIASGSDDLSVMFLSFSMSSIISEFALSGAEAGAIATITNLGMLVGGLIFGVIGDRYHRLTMLKLTLLIFSLATVGISFASSIEMIYLLRFIAGIGVGGEYGIALSIMANIVPADRMGRISSLNGIAGQAGSISSALLAGVFVSSLGWRGLFLFGLLPLAIVLYLHFFVKDDQAFYPVAKEEVTGEKPSMKHLFTTREQSYQTVVLMLMCTIQIAGYFGMMNWLPTIMQEQLGLSVSDSSVWMISTILGMSLGMLFFGRFLDKFGPRLMFAIYLLASAVFVFLFSFVQSQGQMLLAGAMMGFFVNGMFPGYGAIVSRLYPKEVQAIANNTILNVGRAVGGFSSVIIGSIMEHSGVSTVMLFLASLYLVSFCLMLTLPNLKREFYQGKIVHN